MILKWKEMMNNGIAIEVDNIYAIMYTCGLVYVLDM